jgi:hypothetical protein
VLVVSLVAVVVVAGFVFLPVTHPSSPAYCRGGYGCYIRVSVSCVVIKFGAMVTIYGDYFFPWRDCSYTSLSAWMHSL